MNLNFTKLFPSKSSPSQPVTVKANRAMILALADGPSVHVDTGKEVIITRATLAQLEQGDVTVLSGGTPEAEPVANPTPPRREIEPMPEAWQGLPVCFKAYWQTQEELRVARLHLEEIAQCRIDTFGTDSKLFGNRDTHTVIVNKIDWEPRANVSSQAAIIDITDPRNQQLERYLAAAELGAKDYLDRLIESRSLPMQRAYLECGFHRVGVAEKLAEIIAELNDIGFALFSTRIAALGLAEWHSRKLYSGSADFLRFSDHCPAHTGGMRFAGQAEDGSMNRYTDEPVSTSATHSLNMTARIEELSGLLTLGRSELAKAQKVASKAA